jgi:hypothetical protein
LPWQVPWNNPLDALIMTLPTEYHQPFSITMK